MEKKYTIKHKADFAENSKEISEKILNELMKKFDFDDTTQINIILNSFIISILKILIQKVSEKDLLNILKGIQEMMSINIIHHLNKNKMDKE